MALTPKRQNLEVIRNFSKLLADQQSVEQALQLVEDASIEFDDKAASIRRFISEPNFKYVFSRSELTQSKFIKMILEHELKKDKIVRNFFSKKENLLDRDIELLLVQLRTEEETFNNQLALATSKSMELIELSFRLQDHLRKPKSQQVLGQSLFITTCANFETFMNKMHRHTLETDTRLLFDSEQNFKLREILVPNGSSKIRSKVISTQTEAFMHKSGTTWLEWFESKLKFKFDPSLKKDFELVYVSRNKYAHEMSSESLRGREKIYKRIRNAQDLFVKTAFDLICGFFVHNQRKVNGSVEAFKREIHQSVVDLLDAKRYSIANYILSEMISNSIFAPVDSITKVNYWITLIKLNQHNLVRTEVRSWDVSDEPKVYELAKYSLLGNKIKARSLARQLIMSGEIKEINWLVWPLFDTVRGNSKLL